MGGLGVSRLESKGIKIVLRGMRVGAREMETSFRGRVAKVSATKSRQSRGERRLDV